MLGFAKEELPPLIRLWQNPPCIVLGRAEKASKLVRVELAAQRGIPVLRRVSGGGTVLHGPGNLNLSFFLPYSFHPGMSKLKESYRIVLEIVADCIELAFGRRPSIRGSSDLCFGNKKFSGTAQARKRHGLLHHLTLLTDMDIRLIEDLLPLPEKRPEYRQSRGHLDFLTDFKREGIDFLPEAFVSALAKCLGGLEPFQPGEEVFMKTEELLQTRYSKDEWNFQF